MTERDEVKWRQGLPEDMGRLHELWDEQERRFAGTGVKVDRPDLTRAPVMAVRVAERDGAVVGFYHVGAGGGVCVGAGGGGGVETLGPGSGEVLHWLKGKGVVAGGGLRRE